MFVIPVFLVEHLKQKFFFPLKMWAVTAVALPCHYINRFVVVFFAGKAPIPQVNTLINVKLSFPRIP